jgi:ankyrin repeat protein
MESAKLDYKINEGYSPPYDIAYATNLFYEFEDNFNRASLKGYVNNLCNEHVVCLLYFLIKKQKTSLLNEMLKLIDDNILNIANIIVEGFHPLHYSIYKNNLELFNLLLRVYKNIDIENKFSIINSDNFIFLQISPLHIATLLEQKYFVESLLLKGASFNKTFCVSTKTMGRFDNLTALKISSYYGYYDIVKILLEYGANPYLSNSRGYNSIQLAEVNNHQKILELLLNYKN